MPDALQELLLRNQIDGKVTVELAKHVLRQARREAAEEAEKERRMQEVHTGFYELTVKERDYARMQVAYREATIVELTRQISIRDTKIDELMSLGWESGACAEAPNARMQVANREAAIVELVREVSLRNQKIDELELKVRCLREDAKWERHP